MISSNSKSTAFEAELGTELALYTDFYELTMAYGYWKYGKHNQQAVFTLYFRENPFQGGYVIAAGQQTVSEYLQSYSFGQKALSFLSEQRTRSGERPLFSEEFLRYLEDMRLNCEVRAVQEGRLVFPQAPMLRISGPILQCQLLEGPLLNILGFQSLIATKATRVCLAAKGDSVMEFGLRRAHGLQAANWASRAAYIGGVESTSNLSAGLQYGIPLSGTHAHSWVMSFSSEEEAFTRYAELMPEDCVLLVDTYDTLQGIRRAVEVGKAMATIGKKLQALRIDSGDLAYLSQQARQQLDNAELQNVKIIASGDIDEYIIETLKQQKANIAAWGVGTHLSTSFSQPTLGAVYKLSALKHKNRWQGTMKVSSTSHKANIPGRLQLRRFSQPDGAMVADMIYDQQDKIQKKCTIISPHDPIKKRHLDTTQLQQEEMLQPLLRAEVPFKALQRAKSRCTDELKKLHPSILRLTNPHIYPVGLEQQLYQRRLRIESCKTKFYKLKIQILILC